MGPWPGCMEREVRKFDAVVPTQEGAKAFKEMETDLEVG